MNRFTKTGLLRYSAAGFRCRRIVRVQFPFGGTTTMPRFSLPIYVSITLFIGRPCAFDDFPSRNDHRRDAECAL